MRQFQLRDRGGGVTSQIAELLRKRMVEKSTRLQRNDRHHLALVIEGGGMRGVVAGGMVSALEARGLTNCFDSIHGSSAGACAGAYFAAGQARLGTRMFYEDINSRKFVDRRRALVGRPIMNTSFLVENVMRTSKRLDVDKILSSPGVLHVTTTESESGKARVYCKFRDADHLLSVLKATITMPFLAGPAIEVDGAHLVDGGMVQQIALNSALEAGATHILILMTRKSGELERTDRGARLAVELAVLRRLYSARLAEIYRVRNPNINRMLKLILEPGDLEVSIDYIVRPAGSRDVDRLTIDTAALKAADEDAQTAVFRYFDTCGAPV
jgi:predicted patatin/cPLA2 family phospholipase